MTKNVAIYHSAALFVPLLLFWRDTCLQESKICSKFEAFALPEESFATSFCIKALKLLCGLLSSGGFVATVESVAVIVAVSVTVAVAITVAVANGVGVVVVGVGINFIIFGSNLRFL